MAESFATWFSRALEDVRDPVTSAPLKPAQIGERLGFSREKVNTWLNGTRAPGTVEDVVAVAKLLRVSQADVLEAIGYDVHPDGLAEDERQMLLAYRRLRPDPRMQETALAVVRALPLAPRQQDGTSRRRRQAV